MSGKKVWRVLLYLWQLPQHIVGLLLVQLLSCRYYQDYCSARVYVTRTPVGVSLGDYIIVYGHPEAIECIPHEWGHTLQSRRLGPLYLLLVGLPSIGMNIFSRLKIMNEDRYYLRWPENWADRLGGVERL